MQTTALQKPNNRCNAHDCREAITVNAVVAKNLDANMDKDLLQQHEHSEEQIISNISLPVQLHLV